MKYLVEKPLSFKLAPLIYLPAFVVMYLAESGAEALPFFVGLATGIVLWLLTAIGGLTVKDLKGFQKTWKGWRIKYRIFKLSTTESWEERQSWDDRVAKLYNPALQIVAVLVLSVALGVLAEIQYGKLAGVVVMGLSAGFMLTDTAYLWLSFPPANAFQYHLIFVFRNRRILAVEAFFLYFLQVMQPDYPMKGCFVLVFVLGSLACLLYRKFLFRFRSMREAYANP